MAQVSSVARRSARWQVVFNTIVVMAGMLLSRVLGVVREGIFSRLFGVAPEYGAFRATFTILDVLYIVIIGGALGSALIPVFSRLREHGDEDRAWELANSVLTSAFVIFVVIAALVALFARPLLAATVASGPYYVKHPELLALAVSLLRLMIVQPLLLGLGGLVMAMLQTFDRFTLPAIAFNVYNLTIIAAALFLAPRYATPAARVEAVSWGVVGGALLYLLVQLPGVIKVGLRFKPSLNWRMPEVRRVGTLLAPRLFGQAAVQINVIVMVALVGQLNASAQAAYGYAYLLLMLPHGLIAVSLGTVMFPRLTRLFATGQLNVVRDASLQTLRLVLWLTVPAAVMLAVLHIPILRLIYQGNQFTVESLSLTARVLLFFTPAAIGLAGSEIIIRTFYAMEDTRTPVMVGVTMIGLNILIAWSFLQFSRDVGLVTLSYSITNTLRLMLLFGLLARRLPGSLTRQLVHSGVAIVVGAVTLCLTLIAGVVLLRPYVPGLVFASEYAPRNDFLFLAGGLLALGVVGFGVYVAIGAALRAPEVQQLLILIRRRRAA